jgi:hypothetical protein
VGYTVSLLCFIFCLILPLQIWKLFKWILFACMATHWWCNGSSSISCSSLWRESIGWHVNEWMPPYQRTLFLTASTPLPRTPPPPHTHTHTGFVWTTIVYVLKIVVNLNWLFLWHTQIAAHFSYCFFIPYMRANAGYGEILCYKRVSWYADSQGLNISWKSDTSTSNFVTRERWDSISLPCSGFHSCLPHKNNFFLLSHY